MWRVALSLAAAIAVVSPLAVPKGGGLPSGEAAAPPRIISVLGVAQVQGEEVLVDIWVVVPAGEDEGAIIESALTAQGARLAGPQDLQSAQYTTSGLVWDQFFDSNPNNDYVVQNYNPASDPTSGNGEAALTDSEATWTNVATSSFAFQYGGQTSRCPSLVDECPGTQAFDGFNDVGWLVLSGGTTLGVTWYSTSRDEADMALNTAFAWHAGSTSCTNQSGKYDAQTVYLHENGHVVGLSHSDVPAAVMYPTYGGARCQLHQDDISGVSYLYPGGASPTLTPTPTPTPTTTPTPSNTPTPSSTPTATPIADTDGDGCSDSEELGSDATLGGQRDPLNPYDFYDVPVPTAFEGGTMANRDKAVTILGDVLAVAEYSGTTDGGACNAGPDRIQGTGDDRCYDQDNNGDTQKDGRAYDRSVGAVWSDAPNGAITIIEDLLLVLAQTGHSCQAPP